MLTCLTGSYSHPSASGCLQHSGSKNLPSTVLMSREKEDCLGKVNNCAVVTKVIASVFNSVHLGGLTLLLQSMSKLPFISMVAKLD